MNRLYYEKSEIKLMNDLDEGGSSSTQSYLAKVSSIVPSEIIAGYLAMIGFLEKNQDSSLVLHQGLLKGIFIFCLILTPIYFYYQAVKTRPKIIHIVLSTIAFCVWAFVTSGEKFDITFYNGEIASVILVGFSLVSGIIPMKK